MTDAVRYRDAAVHLARGGGWQIFAAASHLSEELSPGMSGVAESECACCAGYDRWDSRVLYSNWSIIKLLDH